MRYEDGYYTAVVQTELSSAFDTISSSNLIDKLSYQGFNGKELYLFRSFLTERKQFVSIDTFK